MPIPDSQTLLLPVLRVLADGLEHSSQEIRERVKVQFDIAPRELSQKHKNGIPVFHNRVVWALANLNMRRGPLGHSEAIERVRKEVYKITEYGRAILGRNPSELTIRDLQRDSCPCQTTTGIARVFALSRPASCSHFPVMDVFRTTKLSRP